ncbi:hypothetical protein PRUPE_2G092400 [Prunus persica]|uniref:DUF1664 domain-containing protein n=1 Tax=Prunus persica TaxID=3760 RepID=A0A251QGQ8_PRUPE|nr:hypothetical protein PRUPE_2G092400 [Prunus persica]
MPTATLGALGYGYMWWKGLKFSDLMYVTKRSMNAAVSKLHKRLESVTEAIARVQNLDDKLLEQKYIEKSIMDNGLKEIAESLSGTLTKSTDAIVQDDIEGPGMKPTNLLRSVSTKC